MNIAIVNKDKPWLVLASTSLIKGLQKKFPDASITFFIEPESLPVLLFNKKVQTMIELFSEQQFDLVINMTPTAESSVFSSSICSGNLVGFMEKPGGVSCTTVGAEEYYKVLFENNKTERHLLQVLYRLCDMTWKGEGYDLSYYPKNRAKKNSIGVGISSGGLREFVRNNLGRTMDNVYLIPDRKNLFKKMDEINRHMYVVTDDLFTLHSSIALRKDVEFLDTAGLPYRMEFFGRGNYYGIFYAEWKSQMQKDECKENPLVPNSSG
jgi:hypothetical protein